MTDVLGARLTNSEDMRRAQDWAVKEMKRIGLRNTKQNIKIQKSTKNLN